MTIKSRFRHVVTDRAGNVIQNAAATPSAMLRDAPLIATPVDPGTVSGLHSWYDFSDATKLWQNTALSTPVSADGQMIKGVSDKSGNGHSATDAAAGPTYKTNIRGGHSVARYNGAHQLTTANFGVALSTPLTIVCVYKDANPFGWMVCSSEVWDDAAQVAAGYANHPPVYGNMWGTNFGYGSGGIGLRSAGPNYLIGPTDTDTQFHIGVGTYNGASSKLWLDGILEIIGTTASDTFPGFILGNAMPTQPEYSILGVRGDVCEILVYSGVLSDADRDGITTFLYDKWGFDDPDALAGDFFAGQNDTTPLVFPLISDEKGVIEAWAESPQALDLTVTDNSNLAFHPADAGTLLDFEPFSVPVKPEQFDPVDTGIRYAAPWGDDNNTGLSWEEPTYTVEAAHEALPGSGGIVNVAKDTHLTPRAATNGTCQGLKILGVRDSQFSSPPTGWIQRKGAVSFVGASGGTASANNTLGYTNVIGGDTILDTDPAIWISAAHGYAFENISATGAAQAVKYGMDSDGVTIGSGDHSTTALTFTRCNFNQTGNGGGCPTIYAGSSFWINYERCHIAGGAFNFTITAATITGTTARFTLAQRHGQNHRLRVGEGVRVRGMTPMEYDSPGEDDGLPGQPGWAMLHKITAVGSNWVECVIDPAPGGVGTVFGTLTPVRADAGCGMKLGESGGPSTGLYSIERCFLGNGVRVRGDTARHVVINDSGSNAGTISGYTQRPLFHVVDAGPFNGSHYVSFSGVADSDDSVIVVDNAVGQQPANPQVTCMDVPGPYEGEAIFAFGTQQDLGGAIRAEAAPSISRIEPQLARIQQDSNRRAFGPTAVRYLNTANQDPASWSVVNGVMTTGQPGPDGLSLAVKVIADDEFAQTVDVPLTGQTCVVGDYVVFGAWMRARVSMTDEITGGLYNEAMVLYTNDTTMEFDRMNTPNGFSKWNHGTFHRYAGKEWVFLTWWDKILSIGTAGAKTLKMQFRSTEHSDFDLYAPVALYIPGSDGHSAHEIAEIARHLQTYSSSAPVGSLAFHDKNNLFLPNNYVDVKEIAKPANPPAGTLRFYAKTSGGVSRLFYIDSGGTERGPL